MKLIPQEQSNCVFRIVRIFLTIACALYLSGAHWAVLQVTAWTGMLMVRSERVGVMAAVETTFSGKQPCRMCKAISAGQKEEKKTTPTDPTLKKLLETKALAVASHDWPQSEIVGETEWPIFSRAFFQRVEEPSIPPPRA